MSALRAEGLRRSREEGGLALYCGLMPDIVNTTDHLWRVGLGPDEEYRRVASLSFARPPLAPPRSTLGSVPRGSWGVALRETVYFPVDRWSTVVRRSLSRALSVLWSGGPQGPGLFYSTNILIGSIGGAHN